jgi:hypothetical protein
MNDNDRPKTVDREPSRVDDWLRRALEPDSDTVQRVVRRSLSAEPSAGPRLRVAATVAGLAAIVLAAAITIFLSRGGPGEATAETARRDSPVEIPIITNVSGEVVVIYPQQAPAGQPDGSDRPASPPEQLTIFNTNGIVAALVVTPTPHYFILGGKR